MKKIDYKKRPLSWSAISSFQYDPEQWYKKYVLNERPPENAAMTFGKIVGERLANDPTYLPEVPRAERFEHELRCKIGGIECIGFIDSYTPGKLLLEYKTGKPWDAMKAKDHGQLKMYALMLYIIDGVKPEELTIKLVSMETEARGDFSMTFVKNMKPLIFEVKLTTRDVLMFGAKLTKIVKEMEEYMNKCRICGGDGYITTSDGYKERCECSIINVDDGDVDD